MLFSDVQRIRDGVFAMVFDRQETDVMLLIAYQKACYPIFSFHKRKEFPRKAYTSPSILFLVSWSATHLFKEVLIGLVPIDYAIAKYHARYMIKPRGIFLAFEMMEERALGELGSVHDVRE